MRLQAYAMEAATIHGRGCRPMQAYVMEAATVGHSSMQRPGSREAPAVMKKIPATSGRPVEVLESDYHPIRV